MRSGRNRFFEKLQRKLDKLIYPRCHRRHVRPRSGEANALPNGSGYATYCSSHITSFTFYNQSCQWDIESHTALNHEMHQQHMSVRPSLSSSPSEPISIPGSTSGQDRGSAAPARIGFRYISQRIRNQDESIFVSFPPSTTITYDFCETGLLNGRLDAGYSSRVVRCS